MTESDRDDLSVELAKNEVADTRNESADPQALVKARIPHDILARYDVFSYRNAAVILHESHPVEFNELLDALRAFNLTTKMIRTAGGNESEIPKMFSSMLRPKGWHETVVQGDLLIDLIWKEQVSVGKSGKPIFERRSRQMKRAKYLDGHKIDYVRA